jgi:hypothetical protein
VLQFLRVGTVPEWWRRFLVQGYLRAKHQVRYRDGEVENLLLRQEVWRLYTPDPEVKLRLPRVWVQVSGWGSVWKGCCRRCRSNCTGAAVCFDVAAVTTTALMPLLLLLLLLLLLGMLLLLLLLLLLRVLLLPLLPPPLPPPV